MIDASTNPGMRGQTRSSWRDESHLRGVLLKLMVNNPDASREELEDMFLAKTRKSPALIDEALRRAFDNDLARVQMPARARSKRPTRDEVDKMADRVRRVVLLDLVLPTGTKLRNATGRECRAAGGWLTAVADQVGDAGIVGVTLSETELEAIFAAQSRRRGGW